MHYIPCIEHVRLWEVLRSSFFSCGWHTAIVAGHSWTCALQELYQPVCLPDMFSRKFVSQKGFEVLLHLEVAETELIKKYMQLLQEATVCQPGFDGVNGSTMRSWRWASPFFLFAPKYVFNFLSCSLSVNPMARKGLTGTSWTSWLAPIAAGLSWWGGNTSWCENNDINRISRSSQVFVDVDSTEHAKRHQIWPICCLKVCLKWIPGGPQIFVENWWKEMFQSDKGIQKGILMDVHSPYFYFKTTSCNSMVGSCVTHPGAKSVSSCFWSSGFSSGETLPVVWDSEPHLLSPSIHGLEAVATLTTGLLELLAQSSPGLWDN